MNKAEQYYSDISNLIKTDDDHYESEINLYNCEIKWNDIEKKSSITLHIDSRLEVHPRDEFKLEMYELEELFLTLDDFAIGELYNTVIFCLVDGYADWLDVVLYNRNGYYGVTHRDMVENDDDIVGHLKLNKVKSTHN